MKDITSDGFLHIKNNNPIVNAFKGVQGRNYSFKRIKNCVEPAINAFKK